MPHQVESLAYTGKPPWHGLGMPVSKDASPEQMQRQAELDWVVEKVPLFYMSRDRSGAPARRESDQYALIRQSDGELLDTVKRSWEPVQNHEAFSFFHDFVRAGDMVMETAGSLANGKWVFALARAKAAFQLSRAAGDVTRSYLLFTNPHRYGHAVDIRFTPVRVVCHNTLSFALGQKDNPYRISFGHRRRFPLEQAQALVRLMVDKLEDYRLKAECLSGKRYRAEDLDRYVRHVFKPTIPPRNPRGDALPLTRNAARAIEIVESQPGHDLAPGTWWNAFNAVTYLTDHEIGRSPATRLTSAWYGPGKARKVRALELALEFACAA